MSTTADDPPAAAGAHAGLQDFFSYPLSQCLQAAAPAGWPRASRCRPARSPTTAPNGPSPLTPLEEAILIASTGVTGAVMHDGPLTKPTGKPELGTPFLHVAGRGAPAPTTPRPAPCS